MSDPIYEVMVILEQITGVQLKNEKRTLVESRLAKRVDTLKMNSLQEYAEYFLAHQETEIPFAISLVTTHTTEFFREDEHFNYLFENVFPRLFASEKNIAIWSAACSTGEEVYSLAIAILEYKRSKGIESNQKITIYGTDIDQNSVTKAKEGIYRKDLLEGLSEDLIKNYFDQGTEELAGYVRVKDFVHEMCDFRQMNLLKDSFEILNVDVIFLRNVLIYFKSEDIKSVVSRLAENMNEKGLLFLGHSESLTGLKTPFSKAGNSIYSFYESHTLTEQKIGLSSSMSKVRTSALPPLRDSIVSKGLILIGASTGGVEALKLVLAAFPEGCPPILIVQHIPANFSSTLAKRLNESSLINITEAQDGEKLEISHAYVAPGGKQMKIRQVQNSLCIEINSDPPMGLHKPSVDYLFKSAVPFASRIEIAAALLTGMGADGAHGLKELRHAGVHTIAQDEKSSVVFGMPGTAVAIQAASEVLPLEKISSRLLLALNKKKAS